MLTLTSILFVGLHTLVAWVLIEVFVNLAHDLSRATYIIWHYLVVVAAFAGVFALYRQWFAAGASPFDVASTAMGFVLAFELVVFRYLYSGERWFLNWTDWIFPLFLATTTVYAVMFF